MDSRGRPVNATYGALYRLDNTFTPGGKFTAVAFWPVSDTGGGYTLAATGRLVWPGSGYFWDLAEGRLVTTSLNGVQLVGPYIVAVDAQPRGNPIQTFHVTAYDTSTFPVRSGV